MLAENGRRHSERPVIRPRHQTNAAADQQDDRHSLNRKVMY